MQAICQRFPRSPKEVRLGCLNTLSATLHLLLEYTKSPLMHVQGGARVHDASPTMTQGFFLQGVLQEECKSATGGSPTCQGAAAHSS